MQGRKHNKLQGMQVQRTRNLNDPKAALKVLVIYNTAQLA